MIQVSFKDSLLFFIFLMMSCIPVTALSSTQTSNLTAPKKNYNTELLYFIKMRNERLYKALQKYPDEMKALNIIQKKYSNLLISSTYTYQSKKNKNIQQVINKIDEGLNIINQDSSLSGLIIDRYLDTVINRLSNNGNYDEVVNYAEQLLNLRVKKYGKTHISVASVRITLSLAYMELEYFILAYKHINAALSTIDLYQGLDHEFLLGLLYSHLGDILIHIGEYEKAVKLLDKALFIIDRNDESGHFSVDILTSRAKALRFLKKYDLAKETIKRALSIYETMGYKEMNINPMLTLQLTSNIEYINILCSSGHCTNGLATAEDLIQKLNNIEHIQKELHKQGREMGLPTESDSLWDLHLSDSLAELYISAARAHFILGNYSQSEKLLNEIPFSNAQKLFIQARLLAKKNNYDLAITKYDEAIVFLNKTVGQKHPKIADAYYNKSLLYQKQKNYEEALKSIREATKIAKINHHKRNNMAESISPIEVNSRAIFKQHVLISNAAKRYSTKQDGSLVLEEFEQSELARFKQTTTAFIAMTAQFSSGNEELPTLIRYQQQLERKKYLLHVTLGKLYATERSKRSQNKIDRLNKELKNVLSSVSSTSDRLETEYPKFSSMIRGVPVRADKIQKVLNANEAILTYLVMDETTHVCVLKKESIYCGLLDIKETNLQKLVSQVRNSTNIEQTSVLKTPPPFSTSSAKQLHKLLINPISKYLSNIKTIYVVTDTQLQSIPFGLFIDSNSPAIDSTYESLRSAPWLFKQYAIARIPSATSLYYLRTSVGSSKASNNFLGFGAPKTRNLKISNENLSQKKIQELNFINKLPELPNTKDELEKIASIYDKQKKAIFTGSSATEAKLRSISLSDYKIISFATHALISGEVFNESEPSLILTPELNAHKLDGMLTASEIAQLNLDAEWVILSACNTANIDESNVSGLPGLSSAFIYSGARAILATHWPVETISAADLTIKLFEIINSHAGITKPQALQQAMLEIMTDEDRPYYSHPVYWAPFEIIGGAHSVQ